MSKKSNIIKNLPKMKANIFDSSNATHRMLSNKLWNRQVINFVLYK